MDHRDRAAALPNTEPTFSQDYACGNVLDSPNNRTCLLSMVALSCDTLIKRYRPIMLLIATQ